MQNHLTRILVNEFIYPAYIHSDTIHFMAEEQEHTLAMHSSWWARLDSNQQPHKAPDLQSGVIPIILY